MIATRWRAHTAALLAVCGVLAFTPAPASAAPAPRKALVGARQSLQAVASQASSNTAQRAIVAATKALEEATAPSLWINPQEADAPSYGTKVFAGSIAALGELHGLAGSAPGVGAAIARIVGADRALAERAISDATGGGPALLAAARHMRAAGDQDAIRGDPVTAARSYARAWRIAFSALTRLVVAELTSTTASDLSAAAENALGSRKIGLSGPMIGTGLKPLTLDGKPEMLFVGSEACPFCGVQRWGMILALSQFGTFSNLHLMQSAVTEPPEDRTFTFFDSSYSSPYIAFVPVEAISNVLVRGNRKIPRGFRFAHLQPLTPAERALFDRFDQFQETPFIDLDNQFITVDSTVLPNLIKRLSWVRLASALRRPASVAAQAIGGEAEVMTAEICEATGGKPRSVCSASVVIQYEQALPLLNGQGGGCPTSGAAGDRLRYAQLDSPGQQPPQARLARCTGR